MFQQDEIDRMRQAASADPTLTVRLCDMLVAAGQADEAVAECRAGLRDRPDDVDLRLALGRALSATGNLEEAQAALFDAVARKRRFTQRNVAPGQTPPPMHTPPPVRTPPPTRNDTPTGLEAHPDPAVPLATSSPNTSRHATSPPPVQGGSGRQGVPTAVSPSGTSRHGVPTPLPATGTSRNQFGGAHPPPPPQPGRFGALPARVPYPPPRKLPPVGPRSRRPMASLLDAPTRVASTESILNESFDLPDLPELADLLPRQPGEVAEPADITNSADIMASIDVTAAVESLEAPPLPPAPSTSRPPPPPPPGSRAGRGISALHNVDAAQRSAADAAVSGEAPQVMSAGRSISALHDFDAIQRSAGEAVPSEVRPVVSGRSASALNYVPVPGEVRPGRSGRTASAVHSTDGLTGTRGAGGPPLPPPTPLPEELTSPLVNPPIPLSSRSGEYDEAPLAAVVLAAAAAEAAGDSQMNLLGAEQAASAQAHAERVLDGAAPFIDDGAQRIAALPIDEQRSASLRAIDSVQHGAVPSIQLPLAQSQGSDVGIEQPNSSSSSELVSARAPSSFPFPAHVSSPPAATLPALLSGPAALPHGERQRERERQRQAAAPLPVDVSEGSLPTFDLGPVAQRLRGHFKGDSGRLVDTAVRERPGQVLFDRQRARIFTGIWIALGLVAVGVVVGWVTRVATTVSDLRGELRRAATLSGTARYEDALVARELYQQALRSAPHDAQVAALTAEAEARLAADHGEATQDSAFVLLRRARDEQHQRRHPDAETEGALRRTAMLLSLARGELCPLLPDSTVERSRREDGDVAARCAWQEGDADAARKILSVADAGSIPVLLFRGELGLSLGDLEEADHAFRTILDRIPQHPRAMLGRSMILAEKGQNPLPMLPPNEHLSPISESWWHLMHGVKALQDGAQDQASAELDKAQGGWRHDARLALAVGRVRLLQGRVVEAEVGLRMAQRRSPSDPDLTVFDAEVALAKGYDDKVVRALLPLAEGEGASARLLATLGRAQFMQGDYRDATATLERSLRRAPGEVTALTYLALCRARNGADTDAVHELEQLARAEGPVTSPHYGLALLAYDHKDLDRAAAEAQQALERNPDAARARALLGRVLREQGKLVPAIAELTRVTQDVPTLSAPHRLLGRIYLDLGRMRDARGAFLKVVESGQATVEDYLALAEATLGMGLRKQADQVIAEARAAGATPGKLSRVNLVMQSFVGPQQALLAAGQLEAERKANPHDTSLTLLAASTWLRAGDLKTALDDFEMAHGTPMMALLGIARTQFQLHNMTEAEAAYRTALVQWNKGPYGADQLAEAKVGLAKTILLRGAIKEAEGLVEPVLWQNPDFYEAQLVWARVLGEQGKGDQALKVLANAIQQDPKNVDACITMSDVAYRVKGSKGARERYQRCLELNPEAWQSRYIHGALSLIK